jgi:hypothetical protein
MNPESVLKILQWNMDGAPHAKPPKPHPNPKECAAVLNEILLEYTPTVVTLQETDNALLANINLSGYDIQRGPVGLTTLIRRDKFVAVDNREVTPRIQAVALDSTNRGEEGLLVFNFHLPVLNKDKDDRQEAARLLIPRIDKVRVDRSPRLEIMAGDFNMPPYAPFIVGPSALFANRDLTYSSSQRRGTVGRSLYNASWNIFGGMCGAPGTYRRASELHGPWQIPDQMLLDPRLIKGADVNVQIIIKTSKRKLHTRDGNPRKHLPSDHFPVLVSITPNKLLPYLNGNISDYCI